MSVLVRFEDKYGAFSIAEACFGFGEWDKGTTQDSVVVADEDVRIWRGIGSSNVFSLDVGIKEIGTDVLVVVYDMDSAEPGHY